jgi:hypothetical protein
LRIEKLRFSKTPLEAQWFVHSDHKRMWSFYPGAAGACKKIGRAPEVTIIGRTIKLLQRLVYLLFFRV